MLTISAQALHPKPDQLIENAFIESCGVHARALVKFMYSKWSMEDDAIAEDFFDTPETWAKSRPALDQNLSQQKFVQFTNKQVAHIVYSDLDKHNWNFSAIADGLQPTLEKFIEMINTNHLGSRWFDQIAFQDEARWRNLKSLIKSKSI